MKFVGVTKIQDINGQVINIQPQSNEVFIPTKITDFTSPSAGTASKIWDIRYDFDLGAATSVIPSGVTLFFNGGTLDNGVIDGNSTNIKPTSYKCFGDNLTFIPNFKMEYLTPIMFGAKFDNSADDFQAIQKSIDFADLNNIRDIILPNGTSLYDGNLDLKGTVLKGQGGHLSKTVLKCIATSGFAVELTVRSSGLENVRIDSGATRRSTGGVLDGGIFISNGDIPLSTLSRTIMQDVFITNQPGFGVYGAGNLELANWDKVTTQGCLSHPFIFDNGQMIGWTNLDERSFEANFTGLRAFECGGNVLIGWTDGVNASNLGYNLRFNSLEALDCAWNSATRISEYQVIVKSQNCILDRPDIENQRYAEATDHFGNSKTVLATPVKGIDVYSSNVTIEHPYFSSVIESINIQPSTKDITITPPTIFSGTYGVPQANAIIVDASTTGFRFSGSDQSGATVLLKNQSVGADITLNGRKQYGISLSTKDFDIDPRPQSGTISSNILQIDGKFTNVIGEGDVADTIDTIRIHTGYDGFGALEAILFNKNAYDITITNSGNVVTKTGLDLVMSTNACVRLIWNDNSLKWQEI